MGLSPPPPHLLHEGDQGKERLQRDLPLQHAADNELQASESFVGQVAPKVQGPQIAPHACLPLAPSQHIPHVSYRHRLKLVLRQGTLLLQEPKGLSEIVGVAFTMDLPLRDRPSRGPGGHFCSNGGPQLLLHLSMF